MPGDVIDISALAPLAVIALAVGSFIGTLVRRLPAGESVLACRSRCDSCGAALGPMQLVPLVSWLLQRGRCRSCGAPISAFYPLIELSSLGIGLWAVCNVPLSVLPATLLLGWLLLALAAMDWLYLRLCDEVVVALAAAGITAAWFLLPSTVLDHLIGTAAAFLVMAGIRWLYLQIRGREGLGFGDVKLAGAVGAWVGWQGLASVLLVAASSGLFFLLVQRCLSHKISWASKLPFGSHICLGTWLVWLYGPITWGGNG